MYTELCALKLQHDAQCIAKEIAQEVRRRRGN
jgi:hypothetical protein